MKLAVIGTFHKRHKNTFPLIHRVLVDSERKPDEFWLMVEDHDDAAVAESSVAELHEMDLLPAIPENLAIVTCPTPRNSDGSYQIIPYSRKINFALEQTKADAIVYLDNNSIPYPEKYRVMLSALEEHPDWGAVYCTQKRTGFDPTVFHARDVIEDAYCRLNYTQVMHRRTSDRWTQEMRYANPDLADALFWRSLHGSLGAFHPAGGDMILDEHHIPHPGLAHD